MWADRSTAQACVDSAKHDSEATYGKAHRPSVGGTQSRPGLTILHLTSCETLGRKISCSKAQFCSSIKWEQLFVAQKDETCLK